MAQEEQQNAQPQGQDNLQELASALGQGWQRSATNNIGLSSGVFTPQGRELTAAEAQFQLRRADTTADYAHRKMLSSLRGADAMNPRERMEAGRNAATFSALENISRNDAYNLRNLMAGSALDNLVIRRSDYLDRGSDINRARQATDEKIKGLSWDAQESGAVSGLKRQLGRVLAAAVHGVAPPPAAPALTATTPPTPTPAPAPIATSSATTAKSMFGNGDANGYNHNGIRVELPAGIDMRDQQAVANFTEFSNWMIDSDDDDIA